MDPSHPFCSEILPESAPTSGAVIVAAAVARNSSDTVALAHSLPLRHTVTIAESVERSAEKLPERVTPSSHAFAGHSMPDALAG